MYIDVEYLEYKLKEIQKKINKIEDEDSDFTKNEQWKQLRSQQDNLYDLKRQELENERSF